MSYKRRKAKKKSPYSQEYIVEVDGDIKEEINDKIEQWLRNIDEQYGTHYAPTGGQRLL